MANTDKSVPQPTHTASTQTSVTRPASTQISSPRSARDFREEMPPIGAGNALGEAEVRYCIFQKARLEFIRERVTSFEVQELNRMVDDYKSRCASYRARHTDRIAVEKELTEKRLELDSQAERILLAWRQPRVVQRPPQSIPLMAAAPVSVPPASASLPWSIAAAGPISFPADPSVLAGASDRPALDLLKISDASRAQERLVELGFLKGSADGTWGSQSRSALREFRAASGLPASDAWDASAAERLFSPHAVRSAGTPISQRDIPDFIFAPPQGASTHPLNEDDARRLHSRLRELGFYKAKNDLIWTPASRAALREFKRANELSDEDEWNAGIEERLFSANARRSGETDEDRFAVAFTGTWAPDRGACPGAGMVPDPLSITGKRAKAASGSCEFLAVKTNGERWLVRAQCRRSDGKNFLANIAFSRTGNQITWSSENGTTTYLRCGS